MLAVSIIIILKNEGKKKLIPSRCRFKYICITKIMGVRLMEREFFFCGKTAVKLNQIAV